MSLTLAIDGMHCGACVKRVKTALEKVPGVLVGNVAIGRAEVDVGDASVADVLAALEKAGYPAHVSTT